MRRALAEQHAATRRVYELARTGIALLHPRSRPCVAAAFTLYSEILDRIEDIDFASSASAPPSAPAGGCRSRVAAWPGPWRARLDARSRKD